MKSEKAKEYINCIVPSKGNFDYCAEVGRLNGSIYVDVCKAVELAEQEAEERIRRKAIEAFGEGCFCDDKGALCGTCSIQEDFIQKLTKK